MANMKIYKSRPIHFCSTSHHFRNINVSNCLPSKSVKVTKYIFLQLRHSMASVTIYNVSLYVCEPTRGANLLDILASEEVSSVSNLVVDDAGLISDHRLVIASVRLCLPARRSTPYTFRDIKNVNHRQFEQALYSELFTAPTSTVDAFTEQLVSVVTRERVGPRNTCTDTKQTSSQGS